MIRKGIVAGLIFGALDVIPMFFMDFADKNSAVIAAFLSRFAIGLLIFTTNLGVNKMISGLLIGTLLSLPDALITKSFGPILGSGILGGLILGYVAHRQEKK